MKLVEVSNLNRIEHHPYFCVLALLINPSVSELKGVEQVYVCTRRDILVISHPLPQVLGERVFGLQAMT